jgi:hypothetical protein
LNLRWKNGVYNITRNFVVYECTSVADIVELWLHLAENVARLGELRTIPSILVEK